MGVAVTRKLTKTEGRDGNLPATDPNSGRARSVKENVTVPPAALAAFVPDFLPLPFFFPPAIARSSMEMIKIPRLSG